MSGGGMSEVKDPAIKLFGKTISLPETNIPANPQEKSDVGFQIPVKPDPMDICRDITKTEDVHVEDSGNQETSSISEDDKEDQMPNNKDVAQANTKLKEDNVELSSTSQEKVLKKPDKILQCPRCNSSRTKFCYFNNYDVNQPRHFCRNCQRYWTAGGTMRNVPVGAGRRKNKQLATQYRQILIPHNTLPSTMDEIADSASQQLLSYGESPTALRPSARNEKVLKVCSEKPLGESMETVSLKDQNMCANLGSIRENGEEPSQCGSSMTTSSVREDETHEKVTGNEQGGLSASCNNFTPQHSLQCYPITQWASPWNPCWNSTVTATSSVAAAQFSSELTYTSDDSKSNQINWCSPPVMAAPGLCAPTIPMQFIPAPYWGCLSVWPVGAGNIPVARSSGNFSPSLAMTNSLLSNNFQTLGKHSRDENSMVAEKSKKGVIVPRH